MILPLLKYVRGDHLSPDHWLDLFRLLGLPRGTTLEGLLFGDLLKVTDAIIEKAMELKVWIILNTGSIDFFIVYVVYVVPYAYIFNTLEVEFALYF